MATAATANGSAVEVAIKPPMERLRDAVETNPLDFNSWVQLLTLVETEPGVSRETVESTYDRFLGEFPLCFGYWNKYAQYELGLAKAPNAETPAVLDAGEAIKKARDVFERGVVAVHHSVQMWQKYCEFLINTARVPVDDARGALENAVAACANDPLAGPLWDLYIQLETLHNDMHRLNQVFKRIMTQPLSNLEEFWEKYNQFVLAQQLHVLASTEELHSIGASEEMDEGLLRVKIVNSVEAIKNKTNEGIQKRQTFEAGIDRNYFHVTPVTDAALANWHAYLDYEEIAGDERRCELLYERCLISCANYEQMWVRFAQWKERVEGIEAAVAVFERAVTVFLKYRGTIYLEYAVLLEAHGRTDAAREMYTKVLSTVAPGLVEAYVHAANFERRQQQHNKAKDTFERGLEALVNQPDAFAYLAVVYATFAQRILGDTAFAREIYQRVVGKVTSSVILWVNYIQFELGLGGDDVVDRVSALYSNALAELNDLSNEEKNDLWIQYGEFMATYAPSIAEVRAVQEKEAMWRRKNGISRERVVKILTIEAPSTDDSAAVGSKRPRQETSEPSATSASSVSAAAYAQYYQQYQGYGAQGYSQGDSTQTAASTTAAATSAAYAQYQQQYAAYYQQQQQS